MTDFDAIFKAYDVRGTVPDQFTADGAKALGGAIARVVANVCFRGSFIQDFPHRLKKR